MTKGKDSDDISLKRLVMSAVRIRFSPEVQPIRESAIDKVVEQNIYVASQREWVAMEEIINQGMLSLPRSTPVVASKDIEKSLARLEQSGRLESREREQNTEYRLTQSAFEEIAGNISGLEQQISRIIERLYPNSEVSVSVLEKAFLECICSIFSRLGADYARLLEGKLETEEFLKSPSVLTAIEETSRSFAELNTKAFGAGVLDFFRSTDPEYGTLKWNLAQNYYVFQSLGMTQGAHLLSSTVFADAVFYLDTNVVIHALEPKARHFGTFSVFSTACKNLKTDLCVCQISLDELNRVVDHYRFTIPRVFNKIPEESASKIPGVFFRLYSEEAATAREVDIDSLFEGFTHPSEDLRDLYDIDTVDDSWFDDFLAKTEYEEIRSLIEGSVELRKRRPKSPAALQHDALLLARIKSEREQGKKSTWLVTLDMSLVSASWSLAKKDSSRPTTIILDAVLQWISTVGLDSSDDDRVAEIFSEAIKHYLLPRETFFTLQDFMVLTAIDWQCKELPAEDVEKCIQYLRFNAPELDPNDPKDREKIAYQVTKFFQDPGRKYKSEVSRLEGEIEQLKAANSRLDVANKKQLGSLEIEMEDLKKQLENERNAREMQELKTSAASRLPLCILIGLAVIVTAIYASIHFGDGNNVLQKIGNLWYIPSVASALGLFIAYLILGKERIRTLGPILRRLFNDD